MTSYLPEVNKSHHGIIQNQLHYTYSFPTLQRPVKAIHLDLLDIENLSGGGDLIGCTFEPFTASNPDQLSSMDQSPANLVWVQANPIPDKQNQAESMVFPFRQPVMLTQATFRVITNGNTPLVPGVGMQIKWRLTLFYCDL